MPKAFVALALVAGGCTGDVITARQLPEAVRADAAAVAAGNNQFACDAYGQLGSGNRFFSPFSIATALAMLDAGAAGATDAELRAALHLALPGERAHAAFGAMLDSLATGRDFGAYTLATANRLFAQDGVAFQPDFLERTKADYHAELLPVDFAKAPEEARATINDWVADQTEGKIDELFPSGAFDATTRLALANAIAFRGSWAHRFDHGKTADGEFTLASGDKVIAPLMFTEADIALAEITGAQIAVLPFVGGDLSMVIALPETADGLPAVEAQLSAATLEQWIDGAQRDGEQHEIRLPKFAIEQALPLDAMLRTLGVKAAFTPGAADFSGIDGERDLFVATTEHRAILTVDEDGATAVAASGGGAVVSSLPATFIADHPFLFVIYDHVTHSILFMGRLVDPTR